MQEKSIDKLRELATRELIKYFKAGGSKKLLEKSKMALGTLSAVSRILATERVRDSLQLGIIEAITSNEQDRTNYIKATLSDYVPPKLLKKGKKKR